MKRTTRMFHLLSLTLGAALLLGCTAGCGGQNNSAAQPTVTVADQPAQTSASIPDPSSTPTPTQTALPGPIHINFQPDDATVSSVYVPVEVDPCVAGYTVSPDLSNVVNLGQFPDLTAAQREKLAENGFVVTPGNEEQLFYIYENNTYKEIPQFITADSVLQFYHVFYDYSLRTLEADSLFQSAVTLNRNMLTQVQKEYAAITDPAVKAEALKVLGYFGAAQLAFGQELPSDFPQEIRPLVDSELKLINAAGGSAESPLFGCTVDYSLFTPRGHYTRSEELTRYFKGMSWYGDLPFLLCQSNEEASEPEAVMDAVIITTALCRLPEEDGGALWENIYSPTAFFVGAADDVTPYQLAGIIEKVYGDSPDLNQLADPEKLGSFCRELDTLPQPRINAMTGAAEAEGENVPSDLQFRFMGQRYIPDSEILQKLCNPDYRPLPTGLDVFASFGSRRAADLIAATENPAASWPKYTKIFHELKAEFSALPKSTWQSNMYYGWLWTQNALTGQYGEGYPMFMQNTAWQDKSLATALGSWAELRHDAILYAKGFAAECGDDGSEGTEPPVLRAYVEPNAELYNRLLWLTVCSRENLSARGMLPSSMEYACEEFETMLTFLRDCSAKELSGENLTTEEYKELRTYGGLLESLTTELTSDFPEESPGNGQIRGDWYELEWQADRNMAVIADVGSLTLGYLEEAVGSAAELYVIVPMDGALYLTRGAVFDYFEFVSGGRLTDEEWQAVLLEEAPDRPAFTSSFLVEAIPVS